MILAGKVQAEMSQELADNMQFFYVMATNKSKRPLIHHLSLHEAAIFIVTAFLLT